MDGFWPLKRALEPTLVWNTSDFKWFFCCLLFSKVSYSLCWPSWSQKWIQKYGYIKNTSLSICILPWPGIYSLSLIWPTCLQNRSLIFIYEMQACKFLLLVGKITILQCRIKMPSSPLSWEKFEPYQLTIDCFLPCLSFFPGITSMNHGNVGYSNFL